MGEPRTPHERAVRYAEEARIELNDTAYSEDGRHRRAEVKAVLAQAEATIAVAGYLARLGPVLRRLEQRL